MGRSRSRSRSDSRSHSRSRSRSRSHDRDRDRRSSSSRSRSSSPEDGVRIHIADLGIDCNKKEVENTFKRFGPLMEVWLARNPPCFAFVVYRHKEDAEEAIAEMNGSTLCGCRVRVSLARPRTRGSRRRRGYDPNLRCYQCGERGHFSRDCNEFWRYVKRRPPPVNRSRRFNRRQSRSRSRSRSRRDSRRSRSRDRRSRSRDRDRRSRSRSKERKSKSRQDSRSDKRSRSRSRSKSRSRSQSKSRKSRSRSKSRTRSRKDSTKSEKSDRDSKRDREEMHDGGGDKGANGESSAYIVAADGDN